MICNKIIIGLLECNETPAVDDNHSVCVAHEQKETPTQTIVKLCIVTSVSNSLFRGFLNLWYPDVWSNILN